jgi:hypothetical protein
MPDSARLMWRCGIGCCGCCGCLSFVLQIPHDACENSWNGISNASANAVQFFSRVTDESFLLPRCELSAAFT